jgi:hypothetical protein
VQEPGRRKLSKGRLLAFTLLTPLIILALVEGGARLIERWGGPVPREVESPCHFQQVPLEPPMPEIVGYDRELLAIDPSWADNDGQVVQSPKPDDELRVVFLGGSALGGWGLPTTATLTGIAERLLDEATPDRRVRVINLGKTGWGSPHVAWVFSQTARRLDPDLVVTVMGNNERMDIANALSLFEGDPDTLFKSRGVMRRSAVARLMRPAPEEALDLPSPPMPELYDLDDPERIDRYALGRLHRTVRRIRRAARAPLLVTSVAVNHRYHRLGKEWWFAGEETYNSEPWRTAHWAWYHDAPKLGAAAIRARLRERPDEVASEVLLGALLKRAGDPEADGVLLRAIDRLGPAGGLDRDRRVQLAWATAELWGAGAAAELVAPWIDQLERDVPERQRACDAADLLWYAGDREAAAPWYEQCLLQRMYYRADGVINEGLRRSARRSGVRFYDLEADVRAASPDGIPGWETFYDYCHYNPRGNVLVGHLLATRIAEQLDLPGAIPSAASALEAWDRDRAGRLSDLPELNRWAGVSHDVTLLTALRVDVQNEARQGPPGTALSHTFDGNRDAASASFGRIDGLPIALQSYLRALDADPSFDPARRNLDWLLHTEAGGWTLANLSGDDPWMERLQAFAASRTPRSPR